MERRRISGIHLFLFKDLKLNEKWWRDDVWEKLILSISLDNHNQPFTIEDIQESFKLYFDKIHKDKIKEHIQNLWSNEIYENNFGKFQLKEEVYENYKTQIKKEIQLEKEVREGFTSLLEETCPELNSSHFWTEFYRLCFLPMVQDIVRETYKTLYFSTHTNSNSFTFQNFFSKYENHNVQTFIQKLFSKSVH